MKINEERSKEIYLNTTITVQLMIYTFFLFTSLLDRYANHAEGEIERRGNITHIRLELVKNMT